MKDGLDAEMRECRIKGSYKIGKKEVVEHGK
jgi:hypothetical protein